MQNSFLIVFLLTTIMSGSAQINGADKVSIKHFKNLYKINDSVYRYQNSLAKKNFID